MEAQIEALEPRTSGASFFQQIFGLSTRCFAIAFVHIYYLQEL